MKEIFEELIIPYKGSTTFKFGSMLNDIKNLLKKEHLPLKQVERSNKGCEVDWPWVIITADNSISLVFVRDVLFEIVFENKYKGKLPNGAFLGISLSELKELDNSLEYNDIEDDYASKEGYWVTVDEFDNVDSITIFVKEIEESSFYKYEWLERYL